MQYNNQNNYIENTELEDLVSASSLAGVDEPVFYNDYAIPSPGSIGYMGLAALFAFFGWSRKRRDLSK